MKKTFLLSLLTLYITNLAGEQKTNERIFISSIPKCGTNLIAKLVKALTNKSWESNSNNFLIITPKQARNIPADKFLTTHAMGSVENINIIKNNDYKGFFILRDPRDQVVSFANYIRNKLPHVWPNLSKLPTNKLIMLLITDMSCIKNSTSWAMPELSAYSGIDTFYNSYLSWMQQPFIYTTYFEKLIGPKGGGSEEEQLTEIINIAAHIGRRLTKAEAQKIADGLFGESATFNEGQIGSWKKYFTQEHKNMFKHIAGQLLIDLGYETDFNW